MAEVPELVCVYCLKTGSVSMCVGCRTRLEQAESQAKNWERQAREWRRGYYRLLNQLHPRRRGNP